MYPNPLIYCTCCDPWNLGPRKLIKTTQSPRKVSTKKSRLDPLLPPSKNKIHVPSVATSIPTQKKKLGFLKEESSNLPCVVENGKKEEMIYVSPGYRLFRNREQISVTLGEELFARRLPSDIVSGHKAKSEPPDKAKTESKVLNLIKKTRSGISADLQEQISELTSLIEQMNRDHQAAQNLLRKEAELRCAEMEKNFENMSRQLKESHEQQLRELEDNYKAALREEKLSSQEKIGEIAKEYKYLKNVFHVYQDSVQEEMEEKWANKKMELEQDEKLEREKILLQQKHAMAKKFALESEEEKKRLNESYCVIIENFNREKEELLKQHEMDTIQLKELKQSKKKAVVVNLEKTLQNKFYEAEENYKHTIQTLTEENTFLRQKIITMNEEIFEERARRLNSIPLYETNYDSLDEKNKKGESLSED